VQLEWKRLTVSDLITIGLLVISILGGAWGLRDKVEEMSQDHHQMLKLIEEEQKIVAGMKDQQRDQARLLREFPPHRHAGDGEQLNRKDLIYPNDLPMVPVRDSGLGFRDSVRETAVRNSEFRIQNSELPKVSAEAGRSDAIEGLARLDLGQRPGE